MIEFGVLAATMVPEDTWRRVQMVGEYQPSGVRLVGSKRVSLLCLCNIWINRRQVRQHCLFFYHLGLSFGCEQCTCLYLFCFTGLRFEVTFWEMCPSGGGVVALDSTFSMSLPVGFPSPDPWWFVSG